MSFVVDASVAAAWVLPDENEPAADALMERATKTGFLVPFHWAAEIANVLLIANCRNRLGDAEVIEAKLLRHRMNATIDHAGATVICAVAGTLAEKYALSIYDALYLELADRLKLPSRPLTNVCGTLRHRRG